MATKGYLMLLGGMREIERILKERMHEDDATIRENGVPLLVESMADQIDELKGELKALQSARPLEAKAEAGEPVGWLWDSDPGKPDQKRHYHDGKECPDFADSPYCSTPVPVYLRPAPAANTEGLLRKAVDILLDEWASSNVYRTEKLWGTKLAAYLDQLKQVAALRGEETRP